MALPTLVIHAHPRPGHSIITHDLLQVLIAAPDVQQRSLYELYPDFDIDVAAEQQALQEASLVVWLAPVHWYGVPALMKHWIDQVLLHGWAYGSGGTALRGKAVWWVCSAGAPKTAYAPGGMHMRPFEDFVPPIEQTARFCGMDWLPPFVVHGGHSTSPDRRSAQVQELAEAFGRHRKALGAPQGDAT
jgi:glutathione-regulated potassium-efflux system ancillary protein KefF